MADASVNLRMDGDESGLRASQRRAADGQNSVTAATRRTGGAATRTSREQSSAFGSVKSRLMGMVGAFAAYDLVVGQVTKTLRFMNKEQEKAVASAVKMTAPNRDLSQIATSTEDYDILIRRADDLAMRYGEERGMVREIVFSARSDEFEKDLDGIIKFADIVGAEAQTKVIGAMPRLFGEEMSGEQAVSMTLVAAGKSVANFGRIASLLPKIAEGGGLQGATSQESLAAASVFAGQFEGDDAATILKMLAAKLSTSQFKGLGLTKGVEAVIAASEEDRDDFLKDNTRLRIGLAKYTKDLSLIKQRESEILQEQETIISGGQSALSKKRSFSFTETTMSGRMNLAKEENRKAEQFEIIMNERQSAEGRLKTDAALANEMGKLKQEGTSLLNQRAASAAGGTARMLGGDEGTVAASTRLGAKYGVGLISAPLDILNRLIGSTEEQTEVIKAGQKHPTGAEEPAGGGSLRGAQTAEAAMAD